MNTWQDILDKVNKMWSNKEVFSNHEFQMLVNVLNERAYEARNIGSKADEPSLYMKTFGIPQMINDIEKIKEILNVLQHSMALAGLDIGNIRGRLNKLEDDRSE